MLIRIICISLFLVGTFAHQICELDLLASNPEIREFLPEECLSLDPTRAELLTQEAQMFKDFMDVMNVFDEHRNKTETTEIYDVAKLLDCEKQQDDLKVFVDCVVNKRKIMIESMQTNKI